MNIFHTNPTSIAINIRVHAQVSFFTQKLRTHSSTSHHATTPAITHHSTTHTLTTLAITHTFTTPAIIHQPKVQPCLPQLPQGKKSCSVCVRPTSRPWSVCPDEIFTVRRRVEHWSSFQYHDVESHPTTHQRHSQR